MKTKFTPRQRRAIYEEAKKHLNDNTGICEALDRVLEGKLSEEEYKKNYWLAYDWYIHLYFPELPMVKPKVVSLAGSGYWWPMGAEIRRNKLDEMIELTKKL
jgi:hypothetical protein